MNRDPYNDPTFYDEQEELLSHTLLRGAANVALDLANRQLQGLGTDANGEVLIENPTYRIGGIGVGTVTLVTGTLSLMCFRFFIIWKAFFLWFVLFLGGGYMFSFGDGVLSFLPPATDCIQWNLRL